MNSSQRSLKVGEHRFLTQKPKNDLIKAFRVEPPNHQADESIGTGTACFMNFVISMFSSWDGMVKPVMFMRLKMSFGLNSNKRR